MVPDTAVVILNWNGKHFLRQFLPSVLANTTKRAHIFVADNGSTDDSAEFLRTLFPEIKCLFFPQNFGFAGGYNKAFRQLENYRYFVLLNSDVETPPGWLDPLLDAMDKHKNVAACMPKILSWNNRNQFEYAGAAGGFLDRLGYPFCRGRIFDVLEEDQGQYDTPVQIFWATGACMAIRSEIFFKAGGFDETFFAHQEEIDLCWRIKNRGLQILCLPSSKVYHVGGGTLPAENPHKTYLNFRNNLLLLYKNLPAAEVNRILFLRRILDGVSALRYLLRGDVANMKAILNAHLDFYQIRHKYRSSGAQLPRPARNVRHSSMYQGCIVWDFFIRKKKRFSDLNFPAEFFG